MKRTYICIICPNGCEIEVNYTPGTEDINLSGAGCQRGEAYVRQELTEPKRTISSSIRTAHGELPLASVRLDKPVKREIIPAVMEEIRKIKVEAPVSIGDIVIHDVLGSGSDVIITKNVARVSETME